MTQEQRKALAKWYGLQVMIKGDTASSGLDYGLYISPFGKNDNLYSGTDLWQPDSDMNQLKMLMDKFIEEAQVMYISYTIRDGAEYFNSGADLLYKSQGSSISECDLNVLIQYTESK